MEASKTISIIIAAAGSSSRLGKNISKQFVLLGNKPLLVYSIEKLLLLHNVNEIIVVTSDLASTDAVLKEYKFQHNKKIKVVKGGNLRQESVFNGFCQVFKEAAFVLIHDVARPLFDIAEVKKCIEKAIMTGAAVLAVPVVDTLKYAKPYKDELIVSDTLNREELYLIQTPQVFSYKLLSKAYKMYEGLNKTNQEYSLFTDEARMIELLGETISIVIGSRKNIKITYPEDLEIASGILKNVEKQRSKEMETICLKQ